MRVVCAGIVAVSLSLFTTATASANPGGVAGYTGKPTPLAPQGESCNQCHNGGTAPAVSITGPATLAAGQAAEYSLVVSTGQTRAAGAVAATGGVVLANVSGLRDSFGELVQDAPLNVAGGPATFRFPVTAPLTGNTLRLWAVGLAANGAGQGGDKAAHTTKDVSVTGGAPSPVDAGSGSSGSSSSSSSSSSGTSGSSSGGGTDAGSTKPGSNGSSSGGADVGKDGKDGADEVGGRRSMDSTGDGAACATRPLLIASGERVLLPTLTILALVTTLRRRRRPSASD